ncbi:chemotaxis protein CheB [Acidisoma sp. S159]|uniref:chemotaxis protein CheB n=1 Tax=Acidisoma sp. S159 TaxID=1747225 RepID=UPI0020B165CF|nr:chemotaxis protein CheB [Acidisoma sp. S159]
MSQTPAHILPRHPGHVLPPLGLAVIGIGASAGGLEAATQLIEAWPPGSGMAFILVQHLDPSSDSMMAALLTPHTALTVCEAAEGMPIVPGHLYVMPPGAYLSVGEGMLHLTSPPVRQGGARLPFDFLLHSLARQYGKRAACVVLSGTGTDGSAGLRSIKAQGGLVAVQDPTEASYDGMPRNAIETGLADFVLPVAAIPVALSANRVPSAVLAGHEVSDAHPVRINFSPYQEILELVRVQTGHDFANYKSGTLGRRIDRRIALAGLRSAEVAHYRAMLQADNVELDALAGDLLIHVTSFFRDPTVFDMLASTIIPDLIQTHPNGQPLRVWVAGCSTGEETYSLAMLFLEKIEAAERRIKLQVFASDVDAEAIAVAREGAYPSVIKEVVSPERLSRFFVREDAGWRAASNLRAAIVFTVQDVLADPPFSRLDMVSCRNLLIYLRPDAQARVIEAFHFALRDGGILLLGSAENPLGAERGFVAAAKDERIYRRVDRASPGKLGRPSRPQTAALVRPGEEKRVRSEPAPAAPIRPAALAELGRRLVMEAYAPASVLIDTGNMVLFSIGPTDHYLRLPPGHATLDLLAMARSGVRGKLRAALKAARDGKVKVVDAGVVVGEDGSRPFSLVVYPVFEAGEQLLLVCFLDADRPERGDGVPLQPGQVSRVAEIERELDATRAELQRTVRDLELSGEEQRAINEEALSVNEEYQSTNEEMVASKEELQSLNEELTAVNSQLQETLERQRTASDDLQNVLFSTNVATLFLDLDGRIRFFTPAINALFAIIPGDVGRKLTDFAALVPDGALADDVKAVQDRLEPLEHEIEAADGTWFRRRILPYRTSAGRVQGVVITFTDITSRKAAGRALEAAKTEAEAANAAKTRFLAAASHDLRQPLQTLALLQAMLAEAVTGEKARSLVARQNTTLGTVTGMLDTLLDINEIEAGAVQPDVSVFPIDGLLERLRGEFIYHARAKAIQLRVVPCAQHVRSDPKLLEQMIRNLLSNAIKYTAEGRVLLGCRRHGGGLSVEIWDTGSGIKNTDLEMIFEEYYQVGNAARQRSRGLGLGLSIVRRLGKLLGHRVQVSSRFGHGSRFSIELPRLAQYESAPIPTNQPEIAVIRAALRILVVEDDPDLAELLGELLQSQGHEVTTAPNGPEALACAARAVPELLLADYNLPDGPNGLELVGTIRAAAGRTLPAIILTGDICRSTLRAVAEAGCSVLSKPVGLAELGQAIARALMPPDLGRPVIFVVDDDEFVRGVLMETLEGDGRTVAGFPSGEAFLQAYRPGAAGCLLLDAALPGMSGIELLEKLRAAGQNLPVIVITGQSDVPMAIRAMKAGASDFIEKPIDRPGLLASVARALEQSLDAAKLTAWHAAAAAQVAGLTLRQREIMTMVLAGQPSKNIAADLGISQRTVENHRASIMHKTGMSSLPALARLALAASSADPVVQ